MHSKVAVGSVELKVNVAVVEATDEAIDPLSLLSPQPYRWDQVLSKATRTNHRLIE